MQKVACTACGAPVTFASFASVMAVCEYCKATLIKSENAVKNIGVMSDVLQDYSPIQIGTSGIFRSRSFTVIGRIQLKYTAGVWNEWYVLFDDGKAGWLSDANGMYSISEEKTFTQTLPQFDELTPGAIFQIESRRYQVADVRSAQCIAGQGELPFVVGKGWEAFVADLRFDKRILTLDYSDDTGTRAYVGQFVFLDELKCQLLRDEDAVRDSAGKFVGGVTNVDCPNCGSSIPICRGLTPYLVCPSCASEVDASGPIAEVIKAADRAEKLACTIPLAARANIAGKKYEVIGVMRRRARIWVEHEHFEWAEYLLYNERAGFLWIIETDEGWFKCEVVSRWPTVVGDKEVTYLTEPYRFLERYESDVVMAMGAFNWRVSVGDLCELVEYTRFGKRLNSERDKHEIVWSHSVPVALDQVQAWFGKEVKFKAAVYESELSSVSTILLTVLFTLNFIPLFLGFGSTWWIILLGTLAIYLPSKYANYLSSQVL